VVFSGIQHRSDEIARYLGMRYMSETRSARWIGISLGGLLVLLLALNAMSRTEASDSPEPASVEMPAQH
jgi:hypothetical protein